MWAVVTPGSGNTANTFGVGIIDILDYTNTGINKTMRSLNGFDSNGAGSTTVYSGGWNNLSPITAISITSGNGNFTANSTAALYGIA